MGLGCQELRPDMRECMESDENVIGSQGRSMLFILFYFSFYFILFSA